VAYLNDDVNMQPSLHVVYNDDSVGISGVVNVIPEFPFLSSRFLLFIFQSPLDQLVI